MITQADHASDDSAPYWPPAPESDDINKYGYVVLRKLVTPSRSLNREVQALAAGKKYVKKTKYIFNFNGVRGTDRKRLQLDDVNIKEKDLVGWKEVYCRLPQLKDCKRSPFVAVISRRKCQAQAGHADFPPSKNGKKSFAAIVAIMNKSTLDVWAKSCHHLLRGSPAPSKPIPRTQIRLNKGDVVIMRSDLLHAGSAYDEPNVRLHCYFDSDEVPRVDNKSWHPVAKKAQHSSFFENL
jgi:hypothetical protein